MSSVDLSLAAQRAESDEKFRDQFNPESKQHHGGDKTVIPVAKDITPFGAGAFGGGKIPDSMKGAFPDEGAYVPPPKVEYGAEHDKIMAERVVLNKTKSAINKVNSSIGIMLTDLTDQKKKDNRDSAVEALKKIAKQLDGDDLKSEWAEALNKLCDDAMGSEEDLAKKIHEMANKTNREIFAYNKKMLARVKEIKKEHAAKAKAEKAEEKQPDVVEKLGELEVKGN